MTLTNARATLGLSATATLGAHGTSGKIQLGPSNQNIRLTDATSGYSLLAVFAGSGDSLVLDLLQNDTTGSTAWVAGAAQVETATAAGTITVSGNATAIVTAAGMTGSPKTITFAVANGDTASVWAAKARTAIAADADVAAMFTVGGSTTAITFTRKPTHTFTVPGGTLPIYAANDGTLNIALADDTSAGITEAASSANTTAGVISDGVKIYDGDGKDVEGSDINLTAIFGVQIVVTGDVVTMDGSGSDAGILRGGEVFLKACETFLILDNDYTFVPSAPSSVTITVLGS